MGDASAGPWLDGKKQSDRIQSKSILSIFGQHHDLFVELLINVAIPISATTAIIIEGIQARRGCRFGCR